MTAQGTPLSVALDAPGAKGAEAEDSTRRRWVAPERVAVREGAGGAAAARSEAARLSRGWSREELAPSTGLLQNRGAEDTLPPSSGGEVVGGGGAPTPAPPMDRKAPGVTLLSSSAEAMSRTAEGGCTTGRERDVEAP